MSQTAARQRLAQRIFVEFFIRSFKLRCAAKGRRKEMKRMNGMKRMKEMKKM
jgi:hypothetical protein